jgi:hypothetical protein
MRSGHLARIFGCLALIASTSALADQKTSGSGFAIADGTLIVTANHVVEGCSVLNIPDVGPVTLLKSDPRADLAILKPNRPLATGLRFRSGHPVKLGEEVVVIGYPLRGILSSPPTVTTGIISSLAGLRDDRTQMQISAPVQPGNSGGPVLDRSGSVVGVVESKLDAIKAAVLTGDIPQNVNFAVQSGIVTSLLESYAMNYDFGSFDKEKPVSEIVAAALPAIVVVECLGQALPEKALEREVKAAPIPPCGGNSDEIVAAPIVALYDSIRGKDIEKYQAQWTENATYVRGDTGAVKSRQQKISDRRAEFTRWQSADITMEEITTVERSTTTASVGVVYTMRVVLASGRVAQDTHVLERYDIRCGQTGKWLIERNVDFVARRG